MRYPREALVFEHPEFGIFEFVGTFCDGWVHIKADGREWFCSVIGLDPLTPAARDLLAEIKAGMR